ncbi:7270_t:CDS:2, partial [Acaulospora colombiana]
RNMKAIETSTRVDGVGRNTHIEFYENSMEGEREPHCRSKPTSKSRPNAERSIVHVGRHDHLMRSGRVDDAFWVGGECAVEALVLECDLAWVRISPEMTKKTRAVTIDVKYAIHPTSPYPITPETDTQMKRVASPRLPAASPPNALGVIKMAVMAPGMNKRRTIRPLRRCNDGMLYRLDELGN